MHQVLQHLRKETVLGPGTWVEREREVQHQRAVDRSLFRLTL